MNEQLNPNLSRAVEHFWKTRGQQSKTQGEASGRKDYGERSSVTGGKQLDSFVQLAARLMSDAGLKTEFIFRERRTTILPGYFRPTKEWDLVAVANGHLIAVIEFKSQVGPSFGNNFNNRTEEAIGSATDLWTAYREGALQSSPRPWLGYFMLLEQVDGSMRSVGIREPHFTAFDEFNESSYAKRYELFCQRLVRERLYDSACLILSDRVRGKNGWYCEPSEECSFERFSASLSAHAAAATKLIH